ncbi:MAG: hypothetical protein AAFY56_15045, partial [Pseudomonadota bacterium]
VPFQCSNYWEDTLRLIELVRVASLTLATVMALGITTAQAAQVTGVVGTINEGSRGPELRIAGNDYVVQRSAFDTLGALRGGERISARYTHSEGINWISHIVVID